MIEMHDFSDSNIFFPKSKKCVFVVLFFLLLKRFMSYLHLVLPRVLSVMKICTEYEALFDYV